MLAESLLCAVGVALSITMHTVEPLDTGSRIRTQGSLSDRFSFQQDENKVQNGNLSHEDWCGRAPLLWSTSYFSTLLHCSQDGDNDSTCFVKWFGVQVNEGTDISKCSSWKMEHDNYPLQKKLQTTLKTPKQKQNTIKQAPVTSSSPLFSFPCLLDELGVVQIDIVMLLNYHCILSDGICFPSFSSFNELKPFLSYPYNVYIKIMTKWL